MATRDPNFRITATDDTRGAFASATRGLEGLERRAKGLVGSFGATRAALSGLVGVLGAGALGSSVRGIANLADETGKAAQRAGVTVEAFSALRHAADLSGVSAEGLETALKRLSVNMLETGRGTGEAKDAFAALGISVKNADGTLKASDAVLAEVAERFARMEDGAGKTALAIRIFGRAGADLIPLLNQGASGLAAMRAEAERLGIIIGGKAAKAAEEFNDNMTRLGRAIDGVRIQAFAPLIKDLAGFTGAVLEASQATGSLIAAFGDVANARIMEGLGKSIGEQLNEARARLELARGREGTLAGALLDAPVKQIEQQIEALKRLQQQRALALGGPSTLDPRDLRLLAGQQRTRAPDLPVAPKLKRSKTETDDFKRALESLNSEFGRMQSEGSKVLEILGQYELGTLKVTAAQKDELVAVAAKIDLYKEDTRVKEEATKAAEDLARREIQAAQERARAIEGLLDATKTGRIEENRRQFALVAEELEKGGANAAKAKEAMRALDDELAEIAGRSKDVTDVWQELGPVFESAFEDALVKGGDVRDILKGIEQDILRIGTRLLVTEPLGDWMGNLFKELKGGGGGGGGFGNLLGGLFGGGGGGGGLGIDQVLAGGFFGPFQHGGAFTVPGTGSAERLVPISAAPGERVEITPAGRGGGGHTFNINVNMPAGTSGASAKQAGAEVALAIQGALRLNG